MTATIRTRSRNILHHAIQPMRLRMQLDQEPTKPPAQTLFSHSGELGDIIWSLPAARSAAQGQPFSFVLYPSMHTNRMMTPELSCEIAPLLAMQPYVKEVAYRFQPAGFSLDRFRMHLRDCNLVESHLMALGQPLSIRNEPWLLSPVQKFSAYPVLFARSERYGNQGFDWKAAHAKYGDSAAFVGTESEHAAFIAEVGDLVRLDTPDLLSVAKAIAGCSALVCGQGLIHAIAEGMKKRIVIALHPEFPHRCRFVRDGVTNYLSGETVLPDLW